MEVTFNPVWNLWATILVAVGLLAFVILTYPPRVRHLPPMSRRTLVGLRLATALALIFAMYRPAVTFQDEDDETAVVVLMTDVSRSMTTKDGPGGTTRRQHLLETLAESKTQLDKLKEEVDFRQFDFSTSLEPVESQSETADGVQTAMGANLKAIIDEMQGLKLAAVFLHGDGAQRAVKPVDLDPRVPARKLGQEGVPIYTTPYGATNSAENVIDLAIDDLNIDPVVFEKKSVPVRARVRASGVAGREFVARLLIENRSGKKLGEPGEMLPIPQSSTNKTVIPLKTSANNETMTVEFVFSPELAGEVKVGVEVVPLDDEVLLRNNQRTTLTTVRKGGLKVAYFDVLRNELKFIRGLNQSEKIQVDFQLVLSGKFQGRTQINPEWFRPGAYDVYMIGDVPADVFGNELLQQLSLRIQEGSGLLMLGGYHSFGQGGYAGTAIENVLPVAMKQSERVEPGRIDQSQHIFGDIKLRPTSAGLRHYVMSIDASDKNSQRWLSLPPLSGVNRLEPRNDFVEVLAETEAGEPVLMAIEPGRARVVAFGADETYLWAMSGNHEIHQRFWRQMILWLAHKEFDTDQPVWVRVDPRNFAPQTSVPIQFGARNEKGQPITDANFKVTVQTPTGETKTVPVQRSPDGGVSEFVETEAPGDYWVRVEATKDGTVVGLAALTRFIVDERDLELDNPAADPNLLDEISRATAETTDGQLIPPEKFRSFLEDFLKREAWKTGFQKTTRLNLWDGWPFLLIFMTLLTVEWLLRKRKNLV